MSRPIEKFVVYNLRETYHELGTYEFKIVLNPRFFKSSHYCDMSLVDSDGRPINFKLERWGRKINCSFDINSRVADGVSHVRLALKSSETSNISSGSLSFWIIKP